MSGSCAQPAAPVYFLVGDANPLHELVGQMRDHYVSCGNEVTWTLLRGADHQGERRALSAHREAILDWLSNKRLERPSQDAAAAPDPTDASPPRGEPPEPTPAVTIARSPAPPPSPPTTSCRCSAPGHSTTDGPVGCLLAVGVALAIRKGRIARRRDVSRADSR